MTRPVVLFVNYTPTGTNGVGSIRVDGADWQAAVAQAQAAGSGVVLRAVDMETALCVDRVVIR